MPARRWFILGLFVLFFFLNDDGTISQWAVGKIPVPRDEAEMIYDDVTESIQGYFKGTTIVAASNAIVVLPVLLIFRMPLIGAITFIIFVTGYIPSIGGYIGGGLRRFHRSRVKRADRGTGDAGGADHR